MKSFNKIEQVRLSQLIANEIEEAILSGGFELGSRLPSEQALADQFGVSRNVVREAFKIVQERGLIEIVSGSGAFVCQPKSQAAATSNALSRYMRLVGIDSSVKALYEARRILEGEIARLATERATSEDLETLTSCLARMQQHAGSIDKWTEADLDFHLAAAKATQNPFLSILLKPLVDQMRSVIAEGYLVPGAIETGLAAHAELYTCIKRRDAEGAYRAMMEHLRDSEARVEAYEERGKE